MNAVERFVRDVTERAVKTAAQAAILAVGSENAGHLDALTFHWLPVLGFAAGGFALSVLTSLASQPIGNSESPSALKEPAGAVTVQVPVVVQGEGPVGLDPIQKAAEIFPAS